MTSSDDLHPLRGYSSPTPDAALGSVKRLPPSPPSAPQASSSTPGSGVAIRSLEGLLAVGVLTLGFLLALLPARNSDIWLHLASGRLLANGEYQFGVDPFAFTTSGVYWVNPSWLYDLLSYHLFQWGEGTALVLANAALIALLGWLLILLGRTTSARQKDARSWIAAIFAVFALLTVGSSMPLQPICVSYVFLAVSLWLLERGLAAEQPASLTSWLPVPLLFALWANLDAWFILGPLIVFLYFAGSLFTRAKGIAHTRTLGIVFLAGLAACMLNPHHYRIFALPTLFPFTSEAAILRDDPSFGRFFQSPFQRDYLRFQDIPHLGRLLYYPLVLVGLVSFLLVALAARAGDARVRSGLVRRIPSWLFFLTLSALDASTIPFMAIVVAPLTALNFQEYAQWRKAERSSPALSSTPWAIGGRILTLALLLGLLVAAWPGWLQGQLRAPRGWFVEKDAALVDAVQQVARWRQEGLLRPSETVLNFSPMTADYFAWFSSEHEKSFCDGRWRLCSAAAADYVTVRRALLGEASVREAARHILREHRVACVVVQDSDVERAAAVFQRIVGAPREWTLLLLQGDTMVFGWRDPERVEERDRFVDRRIDFHKRAFHPSENELAPTRGADPGRDSFGWRSYWTKASPAPSHARDEAALYLGYFDLLRPRFVPSHRLAWEYGLAAGIVASGNGLSDLPRWFLDAAALQVSRNDGPRPRLDGSILPLDALAWNLMKSYDMGQDDGPPGLLLLAVRAARRAVKENPYDARAYQLLGEAYLHLSHSTRERAWKNDLSSLTQVRQAQTAVALHRALLLQPDNLQAHTALHVLYRDMGVFDLALQQLREMLRLTPAPDHFTGEARDAQSDRLRQMNRSVEALAAEVRKREDKFENQAARGSVLERAVRALENGLGGKALEILLASDVAVFGKQGTQMELDLLLLVGRLDDAREWMSAMTRGQKEELGIESYYRLRVKLEAAAGDYEACDEELSQMESALNPPVAMEFQAQKFSHVASPRSTPPVAQPPITYRLKAAPSRQVACLKLGQILLDAPGQTPQLLLNRLQAKLYLEHAKVLDAEFRQQAEVEALRGALALERGEVSQAESFLRRAVSLEQNEKEKTPARGMLDWISRSHAEIP